MRSECVLITIFFCCRQRNTFCSSFLSWSCNQNKAKEGCTDPDVCDQPQYQPLHPSWRFFLEVWQRVLKADCGMVQLSDLGSGCSRAAFMPQPLVPAWAMLQLCLHLISSPWSCPWPADLTSSLGFRPTLSVPRSELHQERGLGSKTKKPKPSN